MDGSDREDHVEFPPNAKVPEEMVAFLVTFMSPVSVVVPLPIWLMAMPLVMSESKVISLLWFKFSVPLSFCWLKMDEICALPAVVPLPRLKTAAPDSQTDLTAKVPPVRLNEAFEPMTSIL